MASSAVANPPVVMPKLAAPRHAPQPIYKMAPEQSEEDEIDVEEVYQLLEESAGHRLLESPGPRRRERLTNLTPEEKLNRRKQKNRVAAQAARDRKKETTKRLEDSLRKALLEIGRLKGEVKYLRVENGQLRAENQAIRFAPAPAPPVKPEHDFEQHHVQRPQFGQQSNNNIASIKSAPMAHPQQQPHAGMAAGTDSLGSAVSFNEPQQRERESKSVAKSSSSSRSGRSNSSSRRQLQAICMTKVLMALWSVICTEKGTTTSNCTKSSTSFLKSWTFPSMLTNSAMKSLRRALLRRMLRMDVAKLVRLSKSSQQQLVAQLLVRKAANRKARGRQRDFISATSFRTTSDSAAAHEEAVAIVPQLPKPL